MPVITVLNKSRVPVKIWAKDVESKALDQLTNTANLPFVFHHVAAMPDVHLGTGATIGSVIASQGAISPAAVGVDIGCGMMAVKTNLDYRIVQDNIAKVRSEIERAIPVGFNSNSKISNSVDNWVGWQGHIISLISAFNPVAMDNALYHKAKTQLGSLGGGNHFIEIQLDTENNVWVMLHSGSRNVGKTLAERHIQKAKSLMKTYMIKLADPDLAYLSEGTQEFKQYLVDLTWAQEYAMQNRVEMMNRIMKQLSYLFNNKELLPRLVEVNCHHNYIARENHFGHNVFVTRKGAVRARTGDLGIIPGSMGTGSFIVKGLGNVDSFCSCSHGAGRRMSRSEAKRLFTTKDLEEQTTGIECRKDAGVIDEIPAAYKPIDEVMANQSDLVEIVTKLRQICCIKG